MARQEDQIAPRPPGTVEIPLSAAQRRLWWTDQRQPGSPGNNCWIAVRLHGALDLGALRSSLRDILRRHEALRTRFAAREGRPVQIIDPGAELALDLVDLATKPQNAREPELSTAMHKAGDEPFDLATGPLMRTTLIRMGPQDHVLVLAIHHLVTDSWSLRILYDEFAALYQAHSHGTPVQLRPPPAAHYPDFSLWQHSGLSTAATDAGLTYWRAKLSGLPRLELPADWPHPPVATLDWSVAHFTLDEQDVAALASLGRQQRSTWFMTTLAVFLVLVSRYSGQKDFGVSTAVSGRPRSQMAGSVGFFMNTVVIRNDLSGVRTFRELLNLVRETTIDALTNAEVPFEQLVEELLPSRDPGRVPLAPVAFIQDNTPSTGPALDGLRVEPIANQPGGFTFDLLMALGTNDEQPRGTVRYRTDLFARETIERLVEHYTTLVHAVSHDPDAPVWTLPLLTPQEKNHRAQVNNTGREVPKLALHTLFEQHAATTPDAIAATQIGRELKYRDLDTTANRLAHWLAEIGIGRGDRVGLATGHTAAMLIAQLAILKAGAAIVPLAHGEAAVHVAGQSRLRAALTDTWGVDSLVPLGIPVIDVDSPDLRSYPTTPPNIPTHPDDTALVLYAGDPFGSPTGAELTHHGLVNTFTDLNTRHTVSQSDTTLAISPARFAGNAYQTLGMLIAGGTVIVPDHSRAHDPTHWAKLIANATVLTITPRQAKQLIDQADSFPALRHITIDGRHPNTLPQQIATIAPAATVTSLYGTVEASFHSLIHPDGTVLANHQAHILDRAMQPVPTGVPGVLHLGGTALAKGYLNQGSLTSARFPHWQGQRLFRTNTLARWRRDGTIEFLSEDPGSLRHVRANEVASVLREHDQVADATAAVRRDFEEDQIMVGYLVAGPTGALDLAEIRKNLEDRLPSHLVPDQLVVLDEIPMCPDGQVDWMALPGVDC